MAANRRVDPAGEIISHARASVVYPRSKHRSAGPQERSVVADDPARLRAAKVDAPEFSVGTAGLRLPVLATISGSEDCAGQSNDHPALGIREVHLCQILSGAARLGDPVIATVNCLEDRAFEAYGPPRFCI